MKSLILLLIFALIASPLLSQQKKTTVAVLEFQSVGGFEKNETAILTGRFRNMLVQTNTFDVVEREKMNDILKAQDFNMSDACNTAECAVQVGQLLGVESMIAGDIGLFGETYTIDLRIIDVGTGRILQTLTQDYVGKRDGLLGVMQTMAKELADVVSKRTPVKRFELTVTASAPKGVKSIDILIDGQNVGKNKAAVKLAEGKHKVEARTNSSDYTVFSKEIDLRSGQKIEAKLEYSEIYKKRMAEEAAEKSKEPAVVSKPSNKKLWYIIGGVAVVGGASAILLSGGGGNKSSKGIPDMILPPE
jgi:TolB-like protein